MALAQVSKQFRRSRDGGAEKGGEGESRNDSQSGGKGGNGNKDEERVLLNAVEISGCEGTLLERAKGALTLRPNLAYTLSEVQEEVQRVFDTGYFKSCQPVVDETRDGIKLTIQVEPNQRIQGVAVDGGTELPAEQVEKAFEGQIGDVLNFVHVNNAIKFLNSWYEEEGIFGRVTEADTTNDGKLWIKVTEPKIESITVRAVNKDSGEPVPRLTRDETVLRHVGSRPGKVYSLRQARKDIDAVYRMGLFDDVNIMPEVGEAADRVHLYLNIVERKPGGFSAGGGLSTRGFSEGPLAGFVGNCSYTQRNLFGLNQRLSASLEAGHIDSVFKVDHHDPWIMNDPHHTSRTVTIQNTRNSASTTHASFPTSSGPLSSPLTQAAAAAMHEEEEGLTIRRLLASVEYSRPLLPSLSASASLSVSRAGVRDERGQRRTVDSFGSQLTHSGDFADAMATLCAGAAYSPEHDSHFTASLEQSVPALRRMLRFTRVQAKCDRTLNLGFLKALLSARAGGVFGDLPPYEAFSIGGTNSVRGFEEGAVGSGRHHTVANAELHVPLVSSLAAALFVDYGSDLGSGASVPGNPAGRRGKPGAGYGYGAGLRLDSPVGPLRLEYAFNNDGTGRLHFGVGRT